MTNQRKSQLEILVEKLDRELIARGAQIPWEERFKFTDKEGTPERGAVMKQTKKLYQTAPPLNNALSHIDTSQLAKLLMIKARELNRKRGIRGRDSRVDYYEITDKQIKKNADSVAAVCMKNNLLDKEKGFSTLKVKNYGKAFNLCNCEPFYRQPIAAGRLCTGFLVKEDVIATAGHCVCENNVRDLYIVFGYKMLGLNTPVTWIPNENIYKGVRIIRRICKRMGNQSDWAMIKLDRKVEDREAVTLSEKKISRDRPVYIIGYPLGLPLKYSPGATVSDISEAYFSADLNVYCGNSGSPVFDGKTHAVLGIVVRGDNRDFRLVENCWMSIIYSRTDKYSKEPQCTRVSEFIEYCR